MTEIAEPKLPAVETPVRDFFQDAKALFLHPVRFFRDVAPLRTLSRALAFGLVLHWGAQALGFLTKGATEGAFRRAVENAFRAGGNASVAFQPLLTQTQEFLIGWVFGVAGVLIDPLFTLLKLLLWTSALWLSARLLLRGRAVPYETILKISAYALGAAPLLVLPFAGALAFAAYSFVLAVIGTREILGTSTVRAFWVQALPYAAIFLFLFGMFALFFAFFASLFIVN